MTEAPTKILIDRLFKVVEEFKSEHTVHPSILLEVIALFAAGFLLDQAKNAAFRKKYRSLFVERFRHRYDTLKGNNKQ